MSRKTNNNKNKNENVQLKFVVFVKPTDEDGIVNEQECGWVVLNPELRITKSFKEAHVFSEKPQGHGSFEDWKELIESEKPEWKISKKHLIHI